MSMPTQVHSVQFTIGILVLVFGYIVWGRGPTAFSACCFFLSQNIIFLATIHCSALFLERVQREATAQAHSPFWTVVL